MGDKELFQVSVTFGNYTNRQDAEDIARQIKDMPKAISNSITIKSSYK